VAAVFALLAYLFYDVAVVIAMGSIGFALGDEPPGRRSLPTCRWSCSSC